METKFNFNSQICTSRVQSERLIALGLKKETADMVHTYLNRWDDYHIHEHNWSDISCDEQHIPAWSLHRLINLIPERIGICGLEHKIAIRENSVRYVQSETAYIGPIHGDTLYDKLINCIEWLIKEGYFNKEYLV